MAVNKKQMDEVIAAGIILLLGLGLGYLVGAAFPPYVKTDAPATTDPKPPAAPPKPPEAST